MIQLYISELTIRTLFECMFYALWLRSNTYIHLSATTRLVLMLLSCMFRATDVGVAQVIRVLISLCCIFCGTDVVCVCFSVISMKVIVLGLQHNCTSTFYAPKTLHSK